jgi:hypothetical protein
LGSPQCGFGGEAPPLPADIQRYRNLLHEQIRGGGLRQTLSGSGRGIVTCGGGIDYLPCVWVLVNVLRQVKCNLPIECWYLDCTEIDEDFEVLLGNLGVSCVNASDIQKLHPVRTNPWRRGWQLKPYAIIHSRFREVLFVDADNVPTRNPEYLFENKAYTRFGALFWPDRDILRPCAERFGWPSIWEILDLPFEPLPAIETGQIVIDKARCGEPLRLALHFNEHSDFYYNVVWGDKDTFQFAFRLLEREFGLIRRPPLDCNGLALFQYDHLGRVVFQHRNGDKWSWLGCRHRINGFVFEQEGLALIDELRARISGGRWP